MTIPEYLNGRVVQLLRSPSEKTVVIEVDLDGVELVPGVDLGRLQVVVAEEGVILSGCLDLYKGFLASNDSSLSVSPESLVTPER